MSYFEASSRCSIYEYQRNEESRLQPDQLYVDELYMMMAALRTDKKSNGAARTPAIVRKVEQTGGGLYQVNFHLVDQDLQPQMEVDGEFDNGYWIDPELLLIDRIQVKIAYFKNYNNYIDNEWLSLGDQIDSKDLVAV